MNSAFSKITVQFLWAVHQASWDDYWTSEGFRYLVAAMTPPCFMISYLNYTQPHFITQLYGMIGSPEAKVQFNYFLSQEKKNCRNFCKLTWEETLHCFNIRMFPFVVCLFLTYCRLSISIGQLCQRFCFIYYVIHI